MATLGGHIRHKSIAVVLAGAVAKGAFEAGALVELVASGAKITRIVAASSGALNGSLLAASIHRAASAADLQARIERLAELWVTHGGAGDAFHLNVSEILHRRGLSDQEGLRSLLLNHLEPGPQGRHAGAASLRIVVCPLAGVGVPEAEPRVSSFERMLHFDPSHFETAVGLEPVIDAAVASSSFPIAFVPSDCADLGPCVDGGTVNNTPLGYAVDDNLACEAVFIVAPTRADERITHEKAKALHGVGLVARVADMLINERLHRDIKTFRYTNGVLQKLANVDEARRREVLELLGWEGRRVVPLYCIRPLVALEGNAFSGFRDEDLRRAYVDAGRTRAREVLSGAAHAEID